MTMAFKRCRKVRYVDSVLEGNEKDTTHRSCTAAEKGHRNCAAAMRQQTRKKVCCGKTRMVSDTGVKLQQVTVKVGRAYSSSLGKRAGLVAEQQSTFGVRQK
jgi:hypothetical protein